MRSTQCSQRIASSSDPSARAWAGTSNETTVPITGSACRTRAVTAIAVAGTGTFDRTSLLPQALLSAAPLKARRQLRRPQLRRVVERTLQRRNVSVAGISSPRYRIDSRTLRGQSLAYQPREGELANLDIHRGFGWVLEDIDADNGARPLHDPDLDRAVDGGHGGPGDGALPRRQRRDGLRREPTVRSEPLVWVLKDSSATRPATVTTTATSTLRTPTPSELERLRTRTTQNSNASTWMRRRGAPAARSAATAAAVIPGGPHTYASIASRPGASARSASAVSGSPPSSDLVPMT